MGVSFLHRLLDLHPVVNVLHIYLQNKNVYRNKKKKRVNMTREYNNKQKPEQSNPFEGTPF